jgi:hypothetical protein
MKWVESEAQCYWVLQIIERADRVSSVYGGRTSDRI